jgi:hypothetical protein
VFSHHFFGFFELWPLTFWNVFSHHFFGFFDFGPLNLLKRLFSSFFRHKRNKRMGRDGRVG